MTSFYDDNDSYVAEWLGNLIAAGHLPEGTVDGRSILEIEPAELGSFRQCHFFAGIGGWPYALALAEWPRDREVWTASCPCQPISSAGQRRGHADERHLWPALYRLIAECRPATIFGEQVASKDGREWFAGVRADLEALGYAVGAADLCAASVGAPHIRQRLFWVADAGRERREHRRLNVAGAPRGDQGERHQRERLWPDIGDGGATGGMALSSNSGRGAQQGRHDRKDGWSEAEPGRLRNAGGLGNAWLRCLDGKARRIEPGIQPLANGVPARVGRLRAYGNAIVPQVAAEFVRAMI